MSHADEVVDAAVDAERGLTHAEQSASHLEEFPVFWSIKQDGGMEMGGSGAFDNAIDAGKGTNKFSIEDERLERAFEIMENSGKKGQEMANLAREKGVQIKFGELPSGKFGEYNSETNEIIMSSKFKEENVREELVAPLLGHEIQHAEPFEGVKFPLESPLSDEQRLAIEMRSHKTEANIWKDVQSQTGLDLPALAKSNPTRLEVEIYMDEEVWRQAFFEWSYGDITAAKEIADRYKLRVKGINIPL